MPFCPRCGYEYRPEIETCPDCGTTLVEQPPRRNPTLLHEEPEVLVAEVANETLAGIWAGLLENEGIPCIVKASGVSIGGWGYAAIFPHYLYVRASDEQRAIELLQSFAADDPSVTIRPHPRRW
jgi:hypothetical protein